MPKYRVEVRRWGRYQSTEEAVVEADSPEAAKDIAYEGEMEETYLDLDCEDLDWEVEEIAE